MGIAFTYIEKMDQMGLFSGGGISILDIGSSNLYSADAETIKKFLRKYGRAEMPDADEFAERLAAGSRYDSVRGGLNESFVGELFEKVGMEYVSFDIASGYNTTILDLNRSDLPKRFTKKFDLVLNFGTTEHILNQFNSFKIIHEATKVGGYIYHSLPAIGYVDHGYLTYTSRCFFDVAGYNEYEIVGFWFEGPSGSNKIFESLRSYKTYFRILEKALAEINTTERGKALNDVAVPDIGINVVYRKVNDKPFWGALETSTSVGALSDGVTASYTNAVQITAARGSKANTITSWASGLLKRSDRWFHQPTAESHPIPLTPSHAVVHRTDETNVIRAKGNLVGVSASENADGLPSHGVRWKAYAERMREAIKDLKTVPDVLHFAQTKIGFEHRNNIHHEGKFTALYETELYAEFPHFKAVIDQFADVSGAAPDTIYVHKGRPISNVLFYQTRCVLFCLTHLPTIDIILEIGGGYGAPARLWMLNPIRRPQAYIIVDIPDALFFADVFLSSQFSAEDVYYVPSAAPLDPAILSHHRFVLCPLARLAALAELPVDLVINTGSMQEMSEAWVDFYMAWLDRQRCRYFYSLNYFAQPISYLAESANLWSPRLSPRWTARLLRWNPAFVRMQTDRNYLEMIAERGDETQPSSQEAQKWLSSRFLTGEIFVELMEAIRHCRDEALMLAVLRRSFEELCFHPKELLWLAGWLAETGSREFYGIHQAEIDLLREKLQAERRAGIENIY